MFLHRNPSPPPITTTNTIPLSYADRAKLAKHALGAAIFNLMETKKTNLTLSADVDTTEELLALAENIGPYISVLKIHCDMVKGFNMDTAAALVKIAEDKNFIIFEDRKFVDIGETAMKQYAGGHFQIAEWAKLTNALGLPGEATIKALAEVGKPKGNGLLILAEMSSEGNLIDEKHTRAAVKMAENNKDFVVGFISQRALSDAAFIYFTPGIKFGEKKDDRGQTYNTPETAFAGGTDNIIVGRGIIAAKDKDGKVTLAAQIAAAEAYREEGWKAYLARIEVKQDLSAASRPRMGSAPGNE